MWGGGKEEGNLTEAASCLRGAEDLTREGKAAEVQMQSSSYMQFA